MQQERHEQKKGDPQSTRLDTDEMSLLHSIGEELLASPDRVVTDHQRARLLEMTTPNVSNAWTHVVPALAKYAKSEGKRSFLGYDKGEKAYQNLVEKLYLVVLALYGDGVLLLGARKEECLFAVLRSLVYFKGAFPNWMEAYSAACTVFIKQSQKMIYVLEQHQHAVETKISRHKTAEIVHEVCTKENIIEQFKITDKYFLVKFASYDLALRMFDKSSHWNADIDDFARESGALTEREIALAQNDFNQAVLNRVKLSLTVERPTQGC